MMKIFLALTFMLIMPMIASTFSSKMKYLHPLILAAIMFFFTIIMSMNLSMLYNTSMFAVIMFLIVVGGLLIMFMYFNSFAMNNKMFSTINYCIFWMLKMFLLFLMCFIISYKMGGNYLLMLMLNSPLVEILSMKMKFGVSTNNIYLLYENYSKLLLFSMMYIFYAMIIIVKMLQFNMMKSIRKMNK